MELAGTPAPAETPEKKSPKPAAGWVQGSGKVYEPEKDAFKDYEIPTEKYVKRFQGKKKFAAESGRPELVPDIDAVLQTPVAFREGGKNYWRWKPQHIQGQQMMEQYNASAQGSAKRFLESFGDFDGGRGASQFFTSTPGSPTQLIDSNTFIPFLNGPFYKQLYQYDYLLMHAQAFQLVNHAALAAAAVKIMTRFVLGRGISFSIKNEKAQAIWDDYWERNGMRDKVRQMARDLCWQGELMTRFYERQAGVLTMRIVDPSTCWEVVTDPEDFEHVYYYHFQWPTPYQVWVQGNIPVSKYIIQQVPPTNVAHIKINVSSQEKRGRSDLMPAMPWLKRFDDYFNGTVMKAVLEANLVYKVKIHGDQNDIENIQSDPNFTIMPPPGGTWLENDAVDMTPLSAVMSGSGRGGQGVGQQIASIVATSLNLPTEYFNIEGGAGGARATALVRTDPAVKAVEDRQQILRETLEDQYDRVMEAAIREGRLDASNARKDPSIEPDQNQVDDEKDQSKELPFAAAHRGAVPSKVVVPSKPVVRASFPGRPVRASFRG